LVEDGAKVKFGQEVMEVETDKAIFPVEANGKGFIHIGPYKAGEVVPVLTVVAIIGSETDVYTPGGAPETEPKAEIEKPVGPAAPSLEAAPTPPPVEKRFSSPRARKLAIEKNISLEKVTPSGGGGTRITERDVLAYLKQSPKVSPLAQRVASEAGVDLHGVTGTGPGGRIVKDDVARVLTGQIGACSRTGRADPFRLSCPKLKCWSAFRSARYAPLSPTG
jgi:pyruvate dehydrogenase E2 component (dihydrolipoamide acetyltransferase)